MAPSKYHKEIQEFIAFKANPENVNTPIAEWHRTFAPHLSLPTVYSWSCKPEIMDEITKLFNKIYRNYETPIVQSIIENSKKGNPQSQKLYLQYVMKWIERNESKVTGEITVDANAVARIVAEKLKEDKGDKA